MLLSIKISCILSIRISYILFYILSQIITVTEGLCCYTWDTPQIFHDSL